MAGTTGTAREEAERLVATVLAMAAQSGLGGAAQGRGDKNSSSGTSGLADLLSGVVDQFLGGGQQNTGQQNTGQQGTGQHGGGWSTGSAECCVCPVCRAIANLRNPTAESAERMAAGAADVATGVASLLRGFSAMTGAGAAGTKPKQPPRPTPTPDQAWSAATRDRTAPPQERVPTEQDVREGADPWTAATRAPLPEPRTPEAAAPTQRPPAAPPATGPAATAPAATGRSAAGDPWAAATRAPGGETVTGATADAAATTRANSDTGGNTDVADRPGVDHDVPGTAPAASAAEDRDGGAGDDARPGDPV